MLRGHSTFSLLSISVVQWKEQSNRKELKSMVLHISAWWLWTKFLTFPVSPFIKGSYRRSVIISIKRRVLGASVRNSARGKGHEEGGSAYAKAGSSLRSSPGNSRASTPKPESAYFTALCSHLHLWLYEGLSPTTSLWKRVKLQLQLIKFLGMTSVF